MMKAFDAVLALCALLLIAPSQAWADEYAETVDVFRNAIASKDSFGDTYGYAVFPTIGKAGVGVGGAYGNGRVYVQGEHVGDTKMTQSRLGFQLGAQA